MVREVFIVLRGGRRADGTPVQGHLGAARLFLMIVVGTLPLFLVPPINDKVEELYYITPFIGAALLLTGCMLFGSDKIGPGHAHGVGIHALPGRPDHWPVPVRGHHPRAFPLRRHHHGGHCDGPQTVPLR